jgi:hypothetical protein
MRRVPHNITIVQSANSLRKKQKEIKKGVSMRNVYVITVILSLCLPIFATEPVEPSWSNPVLINTVSVYANGQLSAGMTTLKVTVMESQFGQSTFEYRVGEYGNTFEELKSLQAQLLTAKANGWKVKIGIYNYTDNRWLRGVEIQNQ